MPPYSLLHEDPDFLVLSKEPGIHSVSLPKSDAPSCAQLLLEQFPECQTSSLTREDGGLVNRLDFDTSGVLVAARNRETWLHFRSQFRSYTFQKTYLTILQGELRNEMDIDAPIGNPNRRGKKVRVFQREPRQKDRALPAQTHLSAVRYLASHQCTATKAKTLTGRRHQIRAHSAFAGYPLLGDSLYGSIGSLQELLPETTRSFFLHALSVEFTTPSGKPVLFEAPLPEYVRGYFFPEKEL